MYKRIHENHCHGWCITYAHMIETLMSPSLMRVFWRQTTKKSDKVCTISNFSTLSLNVCNLGSQLLLRMFKLWHTYISSRRMIYQRPHWVAGHLWIYPSHKYSPWVMTLTSSNDLGSSYAIVVVYHLGFSAQTPHTHPKMHATCIV